MLLYVKITHTFVEITHTFVKITQHSYVCENHSSICENHPRICGNHSNGIWASYESRDAHEWAMSHVTHTNKQLIQQVAFESFFGGFFLQVSIESIFDVHKSLLMSEPWVKSHPRMSHVTPTNEPWVTSHARTSSYINLFWRTSRGSRRTHELSFSKSSPKYRAMSHVTPTNKQLIQQLSFESLFCGSFLQVSFDVYKSRLTSELWVTSHPRTSS